MDYEPGNINYQGKDSGVHRWQVDEKTTLYWHPDWLHIAEDMTGLHKRADLELKPGEQASEQHAHEAVQKVAKTLRGE
ncbi:MULTISPECIES: hypothetical protein [Ferrimonas]|uniref:hypothetical protein n=1 Tax=Ferrimonas TaxID=44011 RepID=UPI0004064CEF|nr:MULTISPECIES: hypothetical protein [Ferrimonas]USD38392.1 hypothetical protein J8Z22_04420 [Ferrimonas sp. SCSIO 43195]